MVEEKEGDPKKRHISLRTAQEWLRKLGCEYHSGKDGLFFDGHDDEKVLEFRNDTYLPGIFKHRDFADVWITMGAAEAETWGIDISTLDDSARTDDGEVWVCADDLKPVLAELPKDLQERVTSKQRYEDGKKVLLCYQDDSIVRGAVRHYCSTLCCIFCVSMWF